jgi:hypothetical protein
MPALNSNKKAFLLLLIILDLKCAKEIVEPEIKSNFIEVNGFPDFM